MKKLMKMLMIVLIAAAVMQTYRIYTELKYRCNVLTGQVNQYDNLFEAFIQTAHVRADRDSQQIADLETKLDKLTVDKVESASTKPTTVAQRPQHEHGMNPAN